MERIDAFRTSDGKVFTDLRSAHTYVDNKMGEIVTRHATGLARIDKYSPTIEYLLLALPELAEAARLQQELHAGVRDDD